ncbi:MAG: hypothetical protein JNK82_31065 [Myxococcaceae bacterium]|nr:hypothetical protein [Myxococcaceae bacterium]
MRRALVSVVLVCSACGTPGELPSAGGGSEAGGSEAAAGGGATAGGGANAGGGATATAGGGTATAGGASAGGATAGGASAGGGASTGPDVDRTNPQLFQLGFTAKTADDAGTAWLGTQRAYLDTRATPRGQLVVYLHGATDVANPLTACGSVEHGRLLAGLGFHFFAPCYASDYGVGNCGQDIGGCRLEAFDGMPRHAALTVTRPNSIEERIIKGLEHLGRINPQGDWAWFLNGGQPRWGSIIISGISHGASSAGVIAKVRPVSRAVMLSGPLDTNQPWLTMTSVSPLSAFWGFTHTGDSQHPGHLESFADLNVPGMPVTIEDAGTPWGGSHRLRTSVPTGNGHGSTEAGSASPKYTDGGYIFAPVWRQLYTGGP